MTDEAERKRRQSERVRAYQKRNVEKGLCMYGPHPALPGLQTCERHSRRTGRTRIIDMTGQRFGRLVVVEMVPERRGNKLLWRCRCDCGGEKVTAGILLRRGETTSCGCGSVERARAMKLTHGKCSTSAYKCWLSMIQRCENPNHPGFADYGGRGITVCERWRESFESFSADMGARPSAAHEIDRINNDGNYELGNCRWVTRDRQSRNKRNNRWITFNGETLCAKDWARKVGVNYVTLLRRIKSGWAVDKALVP